MIRGVAEAGAAAAALQLPRVAIFMAILTEIQLTGVAVGSAPGVVSEVVLVTLAGPRDIGVGAVERLIDAPTRNSSAPFLLTSSRIVPDAEQDLTRRLNDRHDLDLFMGAEGQV